MTAPERALVSSPHTDGTGLLERPLAVLAHGRQSFTQADGATREFDGFQVALVTTDHPDMGDHGPTKFFIPQSCITFDPANMPSVASTPSSGRQTPTASTSSVQQIPAATTPSSLQADNSTVLIESPPGRAPLHGLHYATAPDGAVANTGTGPVQPLPPSTTTAASANATYPPTFHGQQPIHPTQPPSTTTAAYPPTFQGQQPMHPTQPPTPPALGQRNTPATPQFMGHNMFGPMGPTATAHPTQYQHQLPMSPYPTGPFLGQRNTPATPLFTSHDMFGPMGSTATAHPMQYPYQPPASPHPTGRLQQQHASTQGATPPMHMPATRPQPHPTGTTPRSGGGPATQLYTAIKPVTIVTDVFTPVASDPDTFARTMRKALTDNKWNGQPMHDRVGQILANINADMREMLELEGAADMTDEQLLNMLIARFPAHKSTDAKIEAVAKMHCTNGENSIVFMATVTKRFMDAIGMDKITDMVRLLSTQHAQERFQRLASIIMHGLPADAQQVFRMQRQNIIDACTSPTGFAMLQQHVVQEYTARAATAMQRKAAPTFMTTTDDKSELVALRARLEALERDNGSKGKGGGASGDKHQSRKPFVPKFPYDPAKATRSCRHCKSAPVSINNMGPGEHWDNHCPNRSTSKDADGED